MAVVLAGEFEPEVLAGLVLAGPVVAGRVVDGAVADGERVARLWLAVGGDAAVLPELQAAAATLRPIVAVATPMSFAFITHPPL